MKRNIFLLLALPIFFMGCAERSLSGPSLQYQTSRRVAVLPFESSNPFISGAALSDFFTVQIMRKMHGVEVIERKDLMKILQEQKLTLSGIIKPGKYSMLGSILGVDAVMVGSAQTLETIQSVSGSISVTVKLVDVSSGRILWADRQKIAYAAWSAREIAEIAELIMEKAASKMISKMDKHFSLQSIPSADAYEVVPRPANVKLAKSDYRGERP